MSLPTSQTAAAMMATIVSATMAYSTALVRRSRVGARPRRRTIAPPRAGKHNSRDPELSGVGVAYEPRMACRGLRVDRSSGRL